MVDPNNAERMDEVSLGNNGDNRMTAFAPLSVLSWNTKWVMDTLFRRVSGLNMLLDDESRIRSLEREEASATLKNGFMARFGNLLTHPDIREYLAFFFSEFPEDENIVSYMELTVARVELFFPRGLWCNGRRFEAEYLAEHVSQFRMIVLPMTTNGLVLAFFYFLDAGTTWRVFVAEVSLSWGVIHLLALMGGLNYADGPLLRWYTPMELDGNICL